MLPDVASRMTPPGSSRPERSASLHDRHGGAVLHRTARVLELRLRIDLDVGRIAAQTLEPQEWRAADRIQQRDGERVGVGVLLAARCLGAALAFHDLRVERAHFRQIDEVLWLGLVWKQALEVGEHRLDGAEIDSSEERQRRLASAR